MVSELSTKKNDEPEENHPQIPGSRDPLKGFFNGTLTIRGWQLVAGTVVLIVVVALVVGSSYASRIDRLTEDARELVAEERAKTDQLEGEVEALEDDVSAAEEAADRSDQRADTADERAKASVESELAAGRQRLDERAQALDAREADLVKREEAVGIREAFIAENSFGSGRYEVGADIKAGKYRSEGGSSCYWAKLQTSDSNNILSNHFGPGPQTIVINSPWFETQGCGTWTLVQ